MKFKIKDGQIFPEQNWCCKDERLSNAIYYYEAVGYGHKDKQPLEIEGDDTDSTVNIYGYDRNRIRISYTINYCPFCGEEIEIEQI